MPRRNEKAHPLPRPFKAKRDRRRVYASRLTDWNAGLGRRELRELVDAADDRHWLADHDVVELAHRRSIAAIAAAAA